MIRATSLAFAAALLSPLPAAAQAGAYYAATPAAAPARDNVVVRSIVWRCAEGQCTAGRGELRDAIVCQAVAQQLGKLSAFAVAGKPLDAAALDQCNAHAR